MLITAPRRFNKSVNLHMMECFFENYKYRSVFAKLKIGNTSTMDLCGEIPVVLLDFQDGVTTVNSLDDAIMACRIIIHNAFSKHSYLNTSSKLLPQEKKLVELWCDPVNFVSLHRQHVEVGLLRLCEFVSKYRGTNSTLYAQVHSQE